MVACSYMGPTAHDQRQTADASPKKNESGPAQNSSTVDLQTLFPFQSVRYETQGQSWGCRNADIGPGKQKGTGNRQAVPMDRLFIF